MKKFLFLALVLVIILPLMISASTAEPPKGTKDNPINARTGESGQVVFKGYDADFNEVTAEIVVFVEGELGGKLSIKKINELALMDISSTTYYYCYKVRLTANNINGGNSIIINADDFKAFDHKLVEAPILTEFETVELLNGTSAQMFIGFKTPNAFPNYLVFNKELWVNIIVTPIIEE